MDKIVSQLQSKKIGPFITQVQFHPKHKVGHFDLTLYLKNEEGILSQSPLIQGLYSKGNVSQNIQSWWDIHYSDQADFWGKEPIILGQIGSYAEEVFEMIGKTLEPGGMIFVSLITDMVWEIKSKLHQITRDCLSLRSLEIPPAATPLGRLLYLSGCPIVKSQAFDVQGSSRLAGEKAPNSQMEKEFLRKLHMQLQEFLSRKDQRERSKGEQLCLGNAEDILNRLKEKQN